MAAVIPIIAGRSALVYRAVYKPNNASKIIRAYDSFGSISRRVHISGHMMDMVEPICHDITGERP